MLEPGWYRIPGAKRAHNVAQPDADDAHQYHAACGIPLRDEFVRRDSEIEKCSSCVRELRDAGQRA